jgi:hypothetical protein
MSSECSERLEAIEDGGSVSAMFATRQGGDPMNALETIALDALTTVSGGGSVDDLWQRATAADEEQRKAELATNCNWANVVSPGSCNPNSNTPIGYATADLGSYGQNAAGAFWLGQ